MTPRCPVVAVVGLEDGPQSCAGPGLLASLAPERFTRVGVACGPHESGARREDAGALLARAVVPRPGQREFAERLAALAREHAIEAILPGTTEVARALARARLALDRAGARTPPFRRAAIDRLRTGGLAAACKAARLGVAPMYALAPEASAASFAAATSWPVALIASGGARYRAVDAFDAARAARSLWKSGAERVDVVHVDFSEVYEVCALVSSDGRWLGSAAVRVLADDASLRPWLAVTVEDDRLERAAREALAALDLRGPHSLVLHARGGEIELVDLQPGFPVWIEVALAGGPDLVAMAVDDALGRRVEPGSRAPAGTLFSQTAHDVVTAAPIPLDEVHR